MTEPYGYDDDQLDDDSDDNGQSDKYARVPRAQVRTWEKQSKAAQQAEERAAKAERRLALLEAGVGSLTERQQKALFSDLDGDITAEAVRTAAEELGFVQPAKPAQDADQAAMDRMSQASAGATDPGSDDSIAKLERAAREGGQAGLLAQIQADGHLVVPAG